MLRLVLLADAVLRGVFVKFYPDICISLFLGYFTGMFCFQPLLKCCKPAWYHHPVTGPLPTGTLFTGLSLSFCLPFSLSVCLSLFTPNTQPALYHHPVTGPLPTGTPFTGLSLSAFQSVCPSSFAPNTQPAWCHHPVHRTATNWHTTLSVCLSFGLSVCV